MRAVAAGDVVLFAPPPRLASVILETRGSAPKSGELFVKRVVAVAGDELEITRGAVFRNGSRETPYVTGTPVGVTVENENETPTRRSRRSKTSNTKTPLMTSTFVKPRRTTCDRRASLPGTFSCSEITAVEAWMDTSGGTSRSKTCAAWCGSGSDR